MDNKTWASAKRMFKHENSNNIELKPGVIPPDYKRAHEIITVNEAKIFIKPE